MPLPQASVIPLEADPTPSLLVERVQALDWSKILQSLDHQGFSQLDALLSPSECQELIQTYRQEAGFRKRVIMEQHRFGQGEYQYFAYPLPTIVQTLRTHFYAQLAPLANRWHDALGKAFTFPSHLDSFLENCHQAGQSRPTPLLLKYEAGDYNCLHQDLYGDRVFPLQVAIVLSQSGRDFSGGEFVLTEQKPRSQARVQVLNLSQGDAVIFAVSHRPVPGVRGTYRVNLKHGVSSLTTGQRYCLGVIFHDAA